MYNFFLLPSYIAPQKIHNSVIFFIIGKNNVYVVRKLFIAERLLNPFVVPLFELPALRRLECRHIVCGNNDGRVL